MKNLILVIGRSGSGKDTLIRHAKEVFKDKLRTIYHTRIQYPELKNKAQG